MADGAGRDKDKGARRKFDDEVELLEDKVAAELRIVLAHGLDGAPALWEVLGVAVVKTAHRWAKVECTGGPDSIFEGGFAGGIVSVQGIGLSSIICVHFRGICMKSSYTKGVGQEWRTVSEKGNIQFAKPAIHLIGLL